MDHYYTSHWKFKEGLTFRLSGVLAANTEVIGAFYPDDKEAQKEWEEILRDDNTFLKRLLGRRIAPVLRLRQIASGGNGITEEFEKVRVIEAASLKDALSEAYKLVVSKHGTEKLLYGQEPYSEQVTIGLQPTDISVNKDMVLKDFTGTLVSRPPCILREF